MQGGGGDSRGWAEWPLASGGRQARDEELPELSEQPELAGTCPLLHTLPYGAMPTIPFSEGPRGSQASQAMPVNPRNKCGLEVESAGVAGQEGSRSFPGWRSVVFFSQGHYVNRLRKTNPFLSPSLPHTACAYVSVSHTHTLPLPNHHRLWRGGPMAWFLGAHPE